MVKPIQSSAKRKNDISEDMDIKITINLLESCKS